MEELLEMNKISGRIFIGEAPTKRYRGGNIGELLDLEQL
jgi:hypothetical protein